MSTLLRESEVVFNEGRTKAVPKDVKSLLYGYENMAKSIEEFVSGPNTEEEYKAFLITLMGRCTDNYDKGCERLEAIKTGSLVKFKPKQSIKVVVDGKTKVIFSKNGEYEAELLSNGNLICDINGYKRSYIIHRKLVNLVRIVKPVPKIDALYRF